MNHNPEIGNMIHAAGRMTNYHDQGQGEPVVLLHGSGPGVSAWANWRLNLPVLAQQRRVIAPDMAGFGFTERLNNELYSVSHWVAHLAGLLDSLGLEQVDLVGNSFGGSLALHFSLAYPQRVRRLVLMGAVSLTFPITPGLDAVWGYQPSIENMRRLLDIFAYNRDLVTDELAELRHAAATRPGVQEAFAAMFPAPRQRWVDELACNTETLSALDKQTLIIHGRDDHVIPLSVSIDLHKLINTSQLHVFGQCGHWVQIEHADRFNRLVTDFLSER